MNSSPTKRAYLTKMRTKIHTLNLRIPTWTALAHIGSSEAAKTSYLWFIVVPPLAKLLETTNSSVIFELLRDYFGITLELPFSWVLFYFAALSFASGTLIYSLFCPKIIKDYEKVNEFVTDGNNLEQLGRYASEIGYQPRTNDENPDSRIKNNQDADLEANYWKQKQRSPNIEIPEYLERQFWEIRHYADCVRTPARFGCTILYGIGFAIFAILILQNIGYVLSTVRA